MSRLRKATKKVRKELERVDKHDRSLHVHYPALHDALDELMEAYEQPDYSGMPPKDQWNLTLEYDWKRDMFDLYLFIVDTSKGKVIAYMGKGLYREVPEGAVIPKWQSITKQAIQEGSIIDAFKNVYVKETVWVKK